MDPLRDNCLNRKACMSKIFCSGSETSDLLLVSPPSKMAVCGHDNLRRPTKPKPTNVT